MRLRRQRVLGLLMEHYSEEEIGQQLGISQSSVSRDLRRLAGDAEKLNEDLATARVRQNAIWTLFSQFDRAAAATLKELDGTPPGDSEGRLTKLRLVTGLLGKKCYLLRFADVEARLREEEWRSLRQQYGELTVRLDEMEQATL